MATSPKANVSYPVMIVTSGSSAGTFTGSFAVSSTAIRFILTYDSSTYVGTFIRSSSTINNWAKLPTRSEVDALNNSLPQKPFVPFQTVSAQDYDNLPIGLVYNTGVGEHCPTTSGYILVLTLAFNTDMAKACQFGIDMASTTPKLWYRTRVSQIWRDWKQLVNE